MVIGITGPTGSGKTTIANEFKKFGFIVLNIDLIARKVINKSNKCKKEIKKVFGDETIMENGNINRKILGEYAFKNKNSLYQLNKIVSPFVFSEINKIVMLLKKRQNNTVIDAATMFESKLNVLCDGIVCVFAPKNKRALRIIKRDKISEKLAINRIQSQPDENFYKNKSDFLIKSLSDKDKIHEEIKNIINKIRGTDSEYEE